MSTHVSRPTVVLSTAEEVLALRRSVRSGQAPAPVRLESAAVPQPARAELENRLTGAARACGCGAGNLAGSVTLLAFALWTWLGASSAAGWRAVAWGLGLALAAAVAGKLWALGFARVRYVRTLDALLSLMPPAAAPASLAATGG